MRPTGKSSDNVTGNASGKELDFFYPSRPDIKILKKLNFEAKSGQTTALVGKSGCGINKS